MTIGYARVSTRDQDRGSQEHALIAAGASRWMFVDHGESSRIRDRPQWLACLDYLRPGDTLIVRVLDRLAGTTTMAIETINELHDRGVNIKSLTESDIEPGPRWGGQCSASTRCSRSCASTPSETTPSED
jgi:DNA invertase Pin-like site-specific DNA recombinase